MSYIQLVDEPYLFPQACFFCGNNGKNPVIDMGLDINDLGVEKHIYLCLSCLEDVARAGSMVTKASHEAVETENEMLRGQVALLPRVVEGLTDGIRNLVAVAAADLLSGVAADAGDVPEVREVRVAGSTAPAFGYNPAPSLQ